MMNSQMVSHFPEDNFPQETLSVQKSTENQNQKFCVQNDWKLSPNLKNNSKAYCLKKLDCDIQDTSAIIKTVNDLDVRIVVDNRTKFDWPSNVEIKGDEENILVSNFHFIVPKPKITAFSVKILKFHLKLNCNLFAISHKTLKFALLTRDDENNILYQSNPFEIKMEQHE